MSASVGVASHEAYLCASARTCSTSATLNFLIIAVTALLSLLFQSRLDKIEISAVIDSDPFGNVDIASTRVAGSEEQKCKHKHKK